MRAEDVPAVLVDLECQEFDSTPFVQPRAKPRVSVISTAGLMHRGDPSFSFGGADYRIIDRERSEDVVMSHISTNFDRSGFAQDHNLVFPLDRLDELVARGDIASVARYNYSFMGATPGEALEPAAQQLATVLQQDEVDVALLVPV